MPRLTLLVATLLSAAAIAQAPAPATAASKPRVTVIGDSIQASFGYVPAAVRRLGKGYDLRIDAKVCRRLVSASCPYQGRTPKSALQVIRSKRKALGQTVVMNVGYNDDPSRYYRDVDTTMRALRAAGVKHVVWLTLRAERPEFARSNAAIRKASKRWRKMMRVADWNKVSAGRPWFGSDGLHLNTRGAMALSGLIRTNVRASHRAERLRAARARARRADD
jgi:hypothetical protein